MKRVTLAAAVSLLALTSCASNNDDASIITVSAAASLTDAFTEIGAAFEARNPGIKVRFNFAGSSTLAEQINAGAPVDVFAAASPSSMQRTIDAGTVQDPAIFASNALQIAVPAGNPANITQLSHVADPEVTLVVCDEPVPCGAATVALFKKNGLTLAPKSLEPDVRAVLTKVITDEVDAGIVYRTDVAAAGDAIEGIEIPDASNIINEYTIALTSSARESSQEFIDFVLSDEGQQMLSSWGFMSP